MKKKAVMRLYNFSDAELVTICNQKIAFMHRDANEFSTFGISPQIFNDLKNKVDVFTEMPSDVELIAGQTAVTESKNAKAEEMRVAIRNIMHRVELRFTSDNPVYRKFGANATSTLNDANLLLTAKRVVRVAREHAGDLYSSGLTPEMLSNLNTMANQFVDLLTEMDVKTGERDNAQEKRVEAANDLYTHLLKLTKTGQAIWETSNAAKFNDYVVYNTPAAPNTAKNASDNE